MQDPSWPSFLRLLDSDPKAALTEFYRFLIWTLTKVSPRPMRSLCQDEQEDLKHEIFVHCVQNNFRVLRRYVPSGRPFAAWLYTVAYNASVDYIRKHKLKHEVASIQQNSSQKELIDILPNAKRHPHNHNVWRELLPAVKKIISRLDERCRLLLEMAADELSIKEMVKLLRLSPDQNKKISDDLRYCRKKLKKLLGEGGIDIEGILKP